MKALQAGMLMLSLVAFSFPAELIAQSAEPQIQAVEVSEIKEPAPEEPKPEVEEAETFEVFVDDTETLEDDAEPQSRVPAVIDETGDAPWYDAIWPAAGSFPALSEFGAIPEEPAGLESLAFFNPTITVTKVVTGAVGDTDLTQFSFTVRKLTLNGFSTQPYTFETDGINQITASFGFYSIVENEHEGYESSTEGCSAFFLVGGTQTCTITNEYQAPEVPQSCSLVSDDENTYVGSNPAVLTWEHPIWSDELDTLGAQWIWVSEDVQNPGSVETTTFTRTFTSSAAGTATLKIAADNTYSVLVNGVPASCDGSGENNFETVETCTVPVVAGSNTLSFAVTNTLLPVGYEPVNSETNPAGLYYQLAVPGASCTDVPPAPAPTTATISATKIMCADETDLPNWGAGAADITATTAATFLAENPTCRLQDGWEFQWVADSASNTNPGDNLLTPAAAPWASFGQTVSGMVSATVPAGARIWVREVLKDGFVPFTGQNTDQNVSAEIYCSNDVLNYDNWDFIDPVAAGETYHCVAFNAPKTSDVTMCKQDASGQPLSGWTLTLKGEQVQDLTVPTNVSAGINSNPLLAGVSYLATAMGTWSNQGGANLVDAEYSTTDSWATQMDGYTGFSTDILELQINSAFDPNSVWGAYNSAHTYAQSFTQAAAGPANFRIYDGTGGVQNESWFADNSGTLSLGLTKGYAGVTGQNGCVSFDNVPYGTYNAGEQTQDGWSLVTAPTNPVAIDMPTETFTFVNQRVVVTPEPTFAKVHIYKYLKTATTTAQIPNDSTAPSFPMASSWSAANLGTGSGTYVLGNNEGGTALRYAADTSPMQSPSSYATNEVTDGSVVLPIGAACVADKYRLVGYKTGDSLAAAELAAPVATSPAFTGITADKYVIVVNEDCDDIITGNPGGGSNTAVTIVSSPANPNGWVFFQETATGSGSYVNGPTGQPLGTGSAEFVVNSTGGEAFANAAFKGTRLSQIETLSYKTYRQFGAPALALALQFEIDGNMDDADTAFRGRLIYEPYHTQQASIVTGAWQQWNPLNDAAGTGTGNWWFSNSALSGPSGCTQAAPCTWTEVKAAFPNAGLRDASATSGGVYFKAGGGWTGGFIGNVDEFIIGVKTGLNTVTTTYDFEPSTLVPSSNTIVVRQADLETETDRTIAATNNSGKWFFYNDLNNGTDGPEGINNALGSFVNGPETAPEGLGSGQISVTGTERRNLATYRFKDVQLADIEAMSFSTYSQSAGNGSPTAERAAYLQFNVDFNNSDTFQRRLTFVPGVNGTVALDEWQSWDAIANGSALWLYSGPTWPGTADLGTSPKTWSEILALYPNAETRSTDSFLGFRVGEPYADGFTGNVDDFSIRINNGTSDLTETFDFEPAATVVVTPTDPDQSTQSSSGNNGRSGGRRSQSNSQNNAPQGEVLGTQDERVGECGPLLSQYLKIGQANDAGEVSKLQQFLNLEMMAALPVTGFFGAMTEGAVHAFQKKYWQDVLVPWFGQADSGIMDAADSTGYVYKTTQWKVNMIDCPSLDLPAPSLP